MPYFLFIISFVLCSLITTVSNAQQLFGNTQSTYSAVGSPVSLERNSQKYKVTFKVTMVDNELQLICGMLLISADEVNSVIANDTTKLQDVQTFAFCSLYEDNLDSRIEVVQTTAPDKDDPNITFPAYTIKKNDPSPITFNLTLGISCIVKKYNPASSSLVFTQSKVSTTRIKNCEHCNSMHEDIDEKRKVLQNIQLKVPTLKAQELSILDDSGNGIGDDELKDGLQKHLVAEMDNLHIDSQKTYFDKDHFLMVGDKTRFNNLYKWINDADDGDTLQDITISYDLAHHIPVNCIGVDKTIEIKMSNIRIEKEGEDILLKYDFSFGNSCYIVMEVSCFNHWLNAVATPP